MDDLISRQAAIDALDSQLDYLSKLDARDNPGIENKWYGVNWSKNTIAELPSAQRKGKWIKVKPINGDGDIEAYMCPFCKTGDWDISVDSYNYCPYCGKSVSGVADDPSYPFADDVMMKGEEDE